MTKPITPSEAKKAAREDIPDAVLEAFNELITKNLRGRRSSFKFKEAAALIASKLEIPTSDVYERGYLDIEEEYRKVGWTVKADNPGFNESYDGYWEFLAPATRGRE